MTKLTLENRGEGRFDVMGDMTFFSIDKKVSSDFAFLAGAKQVTLDFGGVGNLDSAGLALLLEWIKYCQAKKVQLQFSHLPEQIQNLAKLSGLDALGYFKIKGSLSDAEHINVGTITDQKQWTN